MKTIYILILGLFLFTSCNLSGEKDGVNKENEKVENDTTAQNENDNNDIQNQISYQWVLVKRTSLKKDTTVNFSPTPPSVITEFKLSGFFSISDLIEIKTDNGKTQRLESRDSGQWELNNKKLELRFGTGDSTSLRTYQIEKLDADSLVLKNIEEGVINTYTKRK